MSQMIYTPSLSNIEEHEADRKATFVIEPLLAGYGMTLGNSLRRVLLSSISGVAVVAFRVEGASHEFTTVPGLKEDLVQLTLNLKGLRFKLSKEALESEVSLPDREPIKLHLKKEGAGVVKAGDIQLHTDLEVVDPDYEIANLDTGASSLELELVVGFGLGYLPIEDSEVSYGDNNYISVDAIFSPITRVRYKLENTRVGRMTNLDKISLFIETDGSMTPQAAFEEAAAILKEHYSTLSGATSIESQPFSNPNEEQEMEVQATETDSRLEIYLEDLQLGARTTNALISNDLHRVKDVIHLTDAELKELKGFGAVALKEVKDKLRELGF